MNAPIMLPRIASVAFRGMEALLVDVQVHIGAGLPSFTIVGLPDKAVGESRERVRAALAGSGLSLPPRRITINLAPADLPKEGSHFDLPIALGLMAAIGALPISAIENAVAMGELGLDGAINRVIGILPAAIAAHAKDKILICPASGGAEAAWSGLGKEGGILAAASLLELVNHFRGRQLLAQPKPLPRPPQALSGPDMREVRGQEKARRALEIAAAGGHNFLFSGAPGIGKSMLAACLPSLLPPLREEEMLELSMLASLAGQMESGEMVSSRPFRNPHHSASMAAMIGGGPYARPGEAVLAHGGVLFLDELPEFSRQVLEALRQPLENGEVSIARARAHMTYPARFQLAAAMNPCRCGFAGDAERGCGRQPKCMRDYLARLSGPFLDRIDIFCTLEAVRPHQLAGRPEAENSAVIAARIAAAREKQAARGEVINAYAMIDSIGETASKEARTLLDEAATRWSFSARFYHRALRVARTIADLANSNKIAHAHMAEALEFRLHPEGM